jgi:hypothetical protein
MTDLTIDGVTVETATVPGLPAIDEELLAVLLEAGFASRVNAYTLIQAAAIATIYRARQHGEGVPRRRKVFNEVLAINALAQTDPEGRA